MPSPQGRAAPPGSLRQHRQILSPGLKRVENSIFPKKKQSKDLGVAAWDTAAASPVAEPTGGGGRIVLTSRVKGHRPQPWSRRSGLPGDDLGLPRSLQQYPKVFVVFKVHKAHQTQFLGVFYTLALSCAFIGASQTGLCYDYGKPKELDYDSVLACKKKILASLDGGGWSVPFTASPVVRSILGL